MKIRISAVTDAGKEREGNEDAFVFCPDLTMRDWSLSATDGYVPLGEYGMLAVVADGMGGANAGEVASGIAMETVRRHFSGADLAGAVASEELMRQLMGEAVACIDRAILERVVEEPDTVGMGTTIVMLWLTGQKAVVAWCGDSRCYSFSPAKGLVCLSKDHSYVQELMDKGEITEKQALEHPDSSVITRCLGDGGVLSEPEFRSVAVAPEEMLLLCSDGLCGYCSDAQIEKTVFRTFSDTDKCRDELLRLAYGVGGQDNITVLAISMIADNASAPSPCKPRPIKAWLRKLWRRTFPLTENPSHN